MLIPARPDPLPFGAVLGDDGIWTQILNRAAGPGRRPALFLDRDGVIVEEANYLHRVGDMHMTAGTADVIRRANGLGLPVVMITNQSGIGRGMFGWDAFAQVQEAILDQLAGDDAFINAVFACPHHKDAEPPFNIADHPDRKPNPGMLLRAADRLSIDLGRSWVVGDRAGDLAAGKRGGLAGGVHVLSGHGARDGERSAALRLAGGGFKVIEADGLRDTIDTLPLFVETSETN